MPPYELDQQRVVDWVRKQITERELGPGDRLPNIEEIAEAVDTSPGTVRLALRILRVTGEIEYRPGKGNYVPKRSR